ncbi:alpha/beta hydrolase [Deinococcus sonorensis]|uniref:Alpha/beta hydrolase n=2 Tax=Deinococcus sonorensis TaxID=309891 RepID=A0AAU7U5F4_9DEIO
MRLLALLLTLLLAAPVAAALSPSVLLRRLDQPDGPSYLLVPHPCLQQRRCPLMVVSHPRGQSAERLLQSTPFSAYVEALTGADIAVLLSNDGGPTGWGRPAALTRLDELHRESVAQFQYSGHTYAFGVSMGGLTALRSALAGPYPVSGVVLLDAWADLRVAWAVPGSHRRELEEAYVLSGPMPPTLDPLVLAEAGPRLPLLVMGSRDDAVVPFMDNGLPLFERAAAPGVSTLVTLHGPHLGGSHFSPALAQRVVQFVTALERLDGGCEDACGAPDQLVEP